MIYTIEKEHILYRDLNSDDRCDRCGAEARHRAVKTVKDETLEVLLCGHHFRANSYELGLKDWLIQTKTEE